MKDQTLGEKAKQIKLLITDVDGVLTDNGVYYSAEGEVFVKFSRRDGMGVERLRNIGIETIILTSEDSPSVVKRAEKLGIKEVHLNIKDKAVKLSEIIRKRGLTNTEVAFIGDDVNDLVAMKIVALSACPADAMESVRIESDYVCKNKGGEGAFRELAEFIIDKKDQQN